MSEHDIVAALGGVSDEKLTDAMKVYERKRKKRPILYRVAAIAAAIAEDLGEDVSAIRIVSIEKI